MHESHPCRASVRVVQKWLARRVSAPAKGPHQLPLQHVRGRQVGAVQHAGTEVWGLRLPVTFCHLRVMVMRYNGMSLWCRVLVYGWVTGRKLGWGRNGVLVQAEGTRCWRRCGG